MPENVQDAWCCGNRGRSDCGGRIPGQRCHPCGLPPPSCSQVAGHGYVHYMALHSRRMCKGDHVVRSEHADQTAEAFHIQSHMFHIILSPCGVWPSAVCMRSNQVVHSFRDCCYCLKPAIRSAGMQPVTFCAPLVTALYAVCTGHLIHVGSI